MLGSGQPATGNEQPETDQPQPQWLKPGEQLAEPLLVMTHGPAGKGSDSLLGAGWTHQHEIQNVSLRFFDGALSQRAAAYDIAYKLGGHASETITYHLPHRVPSPDSTYYPDPHCPIQQQRPDRRFDGTALWLGHSRFLSGQAPPVGSTEGTGILPNGARGRAAGGATVIGDNHHQVQVPIVDHQVHQQTWLFSAQVYVPQHQLPGGEEQQPRDAITGVGFGVFSAREGWGLSGHGGVSSQYVRLTADQWNLLQVRIEITTRGVPGPIPGRPPNNDTVSMRFDYFLNGQFVSSQEPGVHAPSLQRTSRAISLSPAFLVFRGWQNYAPEAYVDNVVVRQALPPQ